MKLQEATKVLKEYFAWANGECGRTYAPHNPATVKKAIDVAIWVMENRKDEITTAYDWGYADGHDEASGDGVTYSDAEDYYNSLTRQQSGKTEE